MRFASLCMISLLATTACVSSEDDDSDDDNTNDTGDPGDASDDGDDGDDGTPTTYVPRIGTWGYAEVTPVSSSCPAAIDEVGDGDFVIDRADSASFHVIPDDGTAPFTCVTAGSSYTCPDRAAGSVDYPALGATVTFRATASGTFRSATSAAGRQTLTATCTGSGCPQSTCSITVDFVVSAQ